MGAMTPGWIDEDRGRGVRERRAGVAVPGTLSIDLQRERELLARWVRSESASPRRTSLLKGSGAAGIEGAEALCERLLREGWVSRREHLEGGSWHWDWIVWRDLDRLRALLGVAGRQERDAERRSALQEAAAWLEERRSGEDRPVSDPDLLDELTAALEQLQQDKSLRLDGLQSRLALLKAVAAWHDAGMQGLRRDFALEAGGTTKSIGAADWRWLESCFDLERIGITQFAPMLWLAGDLSLCWGSRRVDVAALHCVGIPLGDIGRLEAATGGVERYWLVENRASFERQALRLEPKQVLLWLPGRPSTQWMEAARTLLQAAPAPAWISADADPAGVDIALSVGELWSAQGSGWSPHRMGVEEWGQTAQRWPLNDHDRRLLARLLARTDLPRSLRALCEAMQREGRKAEQEAWL